MHGGISPTLSNLDKLQKIPRPLVITEEGLVCDILWSDPSHETEFWEFNDRGVSFTFGENPLQAFLEKNKLELLCRAHQVVEDGYEFMFGRKLVTVFSAPNYGSDFDNFGGVLVVDKELVCSFVVFKSEGSQMVAFGEDLVG